MKLQKVLLAALLGIALPAQAQNVNRNTNRTGGVLDLPRGVDNVVSIDAHNILLAETSDPDTGQNKQHAPIVVRHVYSGGIARIFGGATIPTEQFVSPYFTRNNSGGGFGNRTNFGGFGMSSVGGFNNMNNNVLTPQANAQFQFNPGLGTLNRVVGMLDRPLPQVAIGDY